MRNHHHPFSSRRDVQMWIISLVVVHVSAGCFQRKITEGPEELDFSSYVKIRLSNLILNKSVFRCCNLPVQIPCSYFFLLEPFSHSIYRCKSSMRWISLQHYWCQLIERILMIYWRVFHSVIFKELYKVIINVVNFIFGNVA